jgi:hypothetical protein
MVVWVSYLKITNSKQFQKEFKSFIFKYVNWRTIMGNIKDVEIFTGDIDTPYKIIRPLEARVETYSIIEPAPTIETANLKLIQLAVSIGANAVIKVEYKSGISLTSFKSLKVTGLAVIKESEDINCPSCGEKIKRIARKCRFCNLEIPSLLNTVSASQSVENTNFNSTSEPLQAGPSLVDPANTEPLKSNDNIKTIIFVVMIVLLLLFVLKKF